MAAETLTQDHTFAVEETASQEVLENRHKLSQQALKDSLENFIDERADFLEESDETSFESLLENHSLLEDIGEKPEADTTEPACTVCIPVALLREDITTIDRTISLLAEAQKKMGKPVEVILWTNARYEDGNQEAIEQEASQRYDSLKEHLRGSTNDALRLRSALQVLPKERATMSQLRANYMDAVAMEGVERGYGFEHPVIWVDADMTQMTDNTLQELEAGVRNFDAKFLHADVRYSADWAERTGLEKQDDATRAFVVNEIQRRQDNRLRSSKDSSAEYIEEWGLAFALGTYLKAGGVNTEFPVDESRNLLEATLDRELKAISNRVYKDSKNLRLQEEYVEGGDLDSIVPSFLWPTDEPPQHLKYIKSAHIGGSGRGQYEKIKQNGVDSLVNNGTGKYELFSDMELKDPGTLGGVISNDEMHNLATLQEDDRRSDELILDPDQVRRQEFSRRVIRRMIDKYFEAA